MAFKLCKVRQSSPAAPSPTRASRTDLPDLEAYIELSGLPEILRVAVLRPRWLLDSVTTLYDPSLVASDLLSYANRMQSKGIAQGKSRRMITSCDAATPTSGTKSLSGL